MNIWERLKSWLMRLCAYSIHLEARVIGVKFQIEKDEGFEIEYNVPKFRYDTNDNEKDV